MKLIKIIALAALAPMAVSCSIIQGKSSSDTISGASAIRRTPAAGTAAPAKSETTPKVRTKPKTKSETKKTTAAPVPETPVQETTPAPVAVAMSDRNLSGEWLIVQVGSEIIDRDEDMPYIIFEPRTGKFYGNNGCNVINGEYKLTADDVFSFTNVVSTRRYCPDVDFQHTINVVFADGESSKARFSEIGTESYIDILSDSGKELLKLRRSNIDFLNGNWAVETINGSPADQVAADIFFDIAERKIHGNTGCNYFNGEIYIDHRQSNAIDFSKMGLTRMACPYSQQETALMVALEQTTTAISGGTDVAMLLDAEGRELITLRRIPIPQE